MNANKKPAPGATRQSNFFEGLCQYDSSSALLDEATREIVSEFNGLRINEAESLGYEQQGDPVDVARIGTYQLNLIKLKSRINNRLREHAVDPDLANVLALVHTLGRIEAEISYAEQRYSSNYS